MSQAQLSGHGRLSQGYLSQLENDEVQNPSAAVIFRLAQALHVDPRVLMQAAGYNHIANGETPEEYEVTVDPELLRFLAQIPHDQQMHLLRLLEGLDQRPQADEPSQVARSEPPRRSAPCRGGRLRRMARVVNQTKGRWSPSVWATPALSAIRRFRGGLMLQASLDGDTTGSLEQLENGQDAVSDSRAVPR